jgi:hypothetical protein
MVPKHRQPTSVFIVAQLTIVASGRMLRGFSLSNDVVVAMHAGIGGFGMWKRHNELFPIGAHNVALAAVDARCRMRLTFAGRRGVVVTAGARVRGVSVAKRQDKLVPTGARRMASRAIFGGYRMRLGSSGRGGAVVASRADIRGVFVTEWKHELLPISGRIAGIDMTSVAQVGGGRVSLRFARGNRAVMTVGTGLSGLRVSKR